MKQFEEKKTGKDIFEGTVNVLLDGIGHVMLDEPNDEAFVEYRRELINDPHLKTGIMQCGEGSAFYCEQTGAVLLKKQEEELFASESACHVLDLLGDATFRNILQRVKDATCESMTAASVAQSEGCGADTAQRYLDTLVQWGIVLTSQSDSDDGHVTVYSANSFARNKIFMLEVICAYAKELSFKKNYLYCWAG